MEKSVVASLQKELKGKTLIGDFVGDSELVQYVQYGTQNILFHSVVANEID